MKFKSIAFAMMLLAAYGCTSSYDKSRLNGENSPQVTICTNGSTINGSKYNVFGIPIGARLAISECKKSSFGYDPGTDKICFQRKAPSLNPVCNETVDIRFPTKQSPKIVSQPPINGLIVNGNIESIEFYTAGYTVQDDVLSQLKQKYGDPQTIIPRKMKNLMGATFDAFIAIWVGNGLHVAYHSIIGEIDSGIVVISTDIGANTREQRLDRTQDPRPL